MRVVDAVGDGVGGESTEDYGMNGPNARAGEQRNGQLGCHAHVDGYAVAFFNSQSLESVGELLHFNVQFSVGKPSNLAFSVRNRFTLPDNRRLAGAFAEGVAIDAVVAEIGLAADEPFGPRKVPFEDFGPGSEPVQLRGSLGPECFRIGNGAGIKLLVLFEGPDVGPGAELGRWGERRGLREEWSRDPDLQRW